MGRYLTHNPLGIKDLGKSLTKCDLKIQTTYIIEGK